MECFVGITFLAIFKSYPLEPVEFDDKFHGHLFYGQLFYGHLFYGHLFYFHLFYGHLFYGHLLYGYLLYGYLLYGYLLLFSTTFGSEEAFLKYSESLAIHVVKGLITHYCSTSRRYLKIIK